MKQARAQGYLQVSDRHRVWYEDHGPADAPVFLFVHGGPGAGFGSRDRDFFDLTRQRVVFFDQRGAGRSQPFAEIADNTTPDLVADMERLREHLGIDAWTLFGGSWGSTLALAYALAHPGRVTGLVLRGVFLCTRAELDWAYRHGANHVWPDEWERFLAPLGGELPQDLLAAYAERLDNGSEAARRDAARAWARWEAVNSFANPDEAKIESIAGAPGMPAMARLELHYFRNGGFLGEDGVLLARAPELAGIPTHIVQGRLDILCPPWSAWRLHRAIQGSRLGIVAGAGHSAHEPVLKAALQAAVAALAPAGG